jgi:hypothetical protein
MSRNELARTNWLNLYFLAVDTIIVVERWIIMVPIDENRTKHKIWVGKDWIDV